MAHKHELVLYAVRSGGTFQLMTENGIIVVEAPTWRELRAKLALTLKRSSARPANVVLLVGRPERRPAPSLPGRKSPASGPFPAVPEVSPLRG
jgi:hypothetical protein